MDKLSRFIDVAIPVQTCNLRCPYCYIAQKGLFLEALPYFTHNAEEIGEAMSQEKLGGICFLNLCGGGETLLPPEMTDIIYELLKQGHYIAVVTNGTVTKRFEDIAKFPPEFLERLLFKFSYHYLEFRRLNLLDCFWNNVRRMRDAGASVSVELTPHDELIPYIEEMKQDCIAHAGAVCHVTVARNVQEGGVPILTEHTRKEYEDIWGSFDSEMFRFKLSTFNVKRKEFCYAGCWSAVLNLGTGIMRQCYCGGVIGNIFSNKPIRWRPVGSNCTDPHCINSHAWLTIGNIPELKDAPGYDEMRDRTAADGSTWLTPRMRDFVSQKLYDNNECFDEKVRRKIDRAGRIRMRIDQVLLGTFRWIRRHLPKKLRKNIARSMRKGTK